jgi:hypothetical protein
MIPRRWLTVLIVAAALVISFLLRDPIQRTVILPLAFLWWLLKLYYRAVPQLFLWVLLVLAVFVSMLRLVPIKNIFYRRQKKEQKPVAGSIETLAHWMKKSPGGVYYKWLIANRLGKNAREILAQRDGHAVSKSFGRLSGRGWNPPHKIDDYLETGLNGSFADFPQPRWLLPWKTLKPTPLDADLGQVIDYLENEMKTSP